MNKNIFKLHAEVCKTLANPKRLEILNLLREREFNVGEIVKHMKVSKANISQHLAIMRVAGILEARREGVNMIYRIGNPKVIKACDLMREVLMEKHLQNEKILKGRK